MTSLLYHQKTVRYIFLVLLILWMVLIFFFSNQSSDVSDDTSDSFIEKVVSAIYPGFNKLKSSEKQDIIDNYSLPVRKSAHFTEFLVLGMLSFVYFCTYSFGKKRFYVILPFLLGLLYAVSDEIHQLFVAGRACRALDVYIDSAGVLMGVLLLYLILSRGDRVWITKT